jgi:IS5 family transposase
VVDLGYRGVDDANPGIEIIHRGKYRSLTRTQRRWLKRRQAIEPALGHLKSDHRLDRCWLKGSLGDALHAVLCAAGYNLRWLMRAMIRLGLKALLLRPEFVSRLVALLRREVGQPGMALADRIGAIIAGPASRGWIVVGASG